MKLQLVLLVLFFTETVFSVSVSYSIDSSRTFETKCFPIIIYNSAVEVNLYFTNHAMENFNPALGDSLPDDYYVSVMFYRRNEILLDKVFLSDYNEIAVCNDEAIAEGYCEQKHYRKLLYEYKDPEASQRHVFSEVLTQSAKYEGIASVTESGIYCLKAYFANSGKYDLTVEQVDPSKLLFDNVRRVIEEHTIRLLLNFFPSLLFFIKWNRWATKNHERIPFFIKSLVIILILKLAMDLLMVVVQLETLPTLKNFRIYGSYIVPFISYIFQHRFRVSFKVFLLLQYCNEFTFEKITPIKSKKLIGSQLCIHFFLLLSVLFKFAFFRFGMYHQHALILYVLHTLLSFILFLSFLIIIWKHYTAVRKYQDLNKTDNPTFRSFRFWIYSTVFYEILPVRMFTYFLIKTTIVWIPYVRSHCIIDETYRDLNITECVILYSIEVLFQYSPLLNFLPSSYEEARDYHFRLE